MSKNILLLAGDGIGVETVSQTKKLILHLNKYHNTKFELEEALIGGCAIDEYGDAYPQETSDLAQKSDAILLGAVGGKKWEHLDIKKRPEIGLLAIRKELDLFANLRPAIVFDELADASSLKKEIISGLDILIVRELTGGIYFGTPKDVEYDDKGQWKAYNTLLYHQYEVKRIAKTAFKLAQKRGKKLCSVDKANVLVATEMWRKEVDIMHKDYTDIELSHLYIDNATMQLVKNPKQFDVILTTNMFGDILSDCAAMLTGSLGMLPSASIGDKNSALYEPVHGSAPDIAGKDLANPIATILSFAMMLKYSFDEPKLALMIENAVKKTLANNYRTTDIASKDSNVIGCNKMGNEIIANL